jgi:hypothetical protein
VLRVCLLPVHSFLVVKGLLRCRKGAEHARIPAVFKTLFASCHASNSFNPEYSPCNEQHHSLHTIIEAICTCDAATFPRALLLRHFLVRRCRPAKFITGCIALLVTVSAAVHKSIINFA